MSNLRKKQNWIKDILSKSGTEITAVKEDKFEGWFKSYNTHQMFVFIFGNGSELLINFVILSSTSPTFNNKKCLPLEIYLMN